MWDPNQLINNPWLNFGMGMLGASAPSTDPRSKSMAYALSQGLGSMQKGNIAAYDIQRGNAYLKMMQESIEANREREAAERKDRLTSVIDQETFNIMMRDPYMRAQMQRLLGGVSPYTQTPGYLTDLY